MHRFGRDRRFSRLIRIAVDRAEKSRGRPSFGQRWLPVPPEGDGLQQTSYRRDRNRQIHEASPAVSRRIADISPSNAETRVAAFEGLTQHVAVQQQISLVKSDTIGTTERHELSEAETVGFPLGLTIRLKMTQILRPLSRARPRFQ